MRRASELWADQTSLKLTETVLNHLKKKLWNVCHVSDVSLSGWLPIGLGLRQRNPPPRAGREGPQGSKPNQLPPPPTHRQARTADILPSLNHWQWEIWKGNRWRGRVVASRWSVFSVVIGVVVFFHGSLCLWCGFKRDDTYQCRQLFCSLRNRISHYANLKCDAETLRFYLRLMDIDSRRFSA